jgi:hypothetical protein
MGKGKGCIASTPVAAAEAQRNVQQHLERIGLRPDIAVACAEQLVAAGYDTAEQIDRLSDEALTRAGFRPGDMDKVAVFRERQGADPPIMATPVAAAASSGRAGGGSGPRASAPAAKEQGGAQAPSRWAPRVLPESGVGASEIWLEMETESGQLRLEGPSSAKDKDGNLSGAQISGNQLIMDTLGDEHCNFVLGAHSALALHLCDRSSPRSAAGPGSSSCCCGCCGCCCGCCGCCGGGCCCF